MKKGFTMLELIFVIVILGILAAVALPRMMGVQEQAKESVAKAFVGTLNRTVGPSMWSKAILDGDGNASIAGTVADGSHTFNLSDYIDIPLGFEDTNLSRCKNGNGAFDPASDAITKDTKNNLYILCRDGNTTAAPRFWYTNQTSPVDSNDSLMKLKP